MSKENNHPVVATDIVAGFGGTMVLDHVSMDAAEYSITMILGASGCGKTTLLKNLIRLLDPWSGSIRIFGGEITGVD